MFCFLSFQRRGQRHDIICEIIRASNAMTDLKGLITVVLDMVLLDITEIEFILSFASSCTYWKYVDTKDFVLKANLSNIESFLYVF